MLTALQTRKLNRAFTLFDVDRNGFMEGTDCELVVSATTQARRSSPKEKNPEDGTRS